MKTFITVMSLIVGALFALAGFLVSIGHKGLASQYLEAGLIISLVTILIILADATYKSFNRRYVRRSNSESSTPPLTTPVIKGERFKFGVFWDADLNPYCPICKSPLVLSRDQLIYRIDGGIPLPLPEPHCFNCNKVLALYDDDGNHITLGEAKKLLSQKETKSEIEPLKSQRLELQTAEPPPVFEPNEIEVKILAFIANSKLHHAYAEEIATALRLHPTLVDHHLDQLEKEDYVKKTRPTRLRPFVYSVTPKGREFVINKNLLGNEKEPEPKIETPEPQPSDSDIPQRKAVSYSFTFRVPTLIELEILKLLADPDCDSYPSSLAIPLQLHPEKVRHYLTELVKAEYVYNVGCHTMTGEPAYSLTDQGRAYLVNNNHI